jgi:hypothetical protein
MGPWTTSTALFINNKKNIRNTSAKKNVSYVVKKIQYQKCFAYDFFLARNTHQLLKNIKKVNLSKFNLNLETNTGVLFIGRYRA